MAVTRSRLLHHVDWQVGAALFLLLAASGVCNTATAQVAPATPQPPPPTPAPPAPMPVSPPAAPPIALPQYRPPVLALVQPTQGTAIPVDRPVVVFRYAAGEPADPVDLASFSVTVDDRARTQLFQVGASEAWGPLAPPGESGAITTGAHTVTARICSTRGACTTQSVTVTLSAGPTASAPATGARRGRIIDLLLTGARRLLEPE